MSQRETILAALQTTLSSLCSGRVYRSRKEQLPALPAIVIKPETEEDGGEMLGCSDVTLVASINVYAHGDIPDQAADSVVSSVLSALSSNATLGLGSDVQIKPSRRIEWNQENYNDAEVVIRVEIQYRTF